MYREDRGGKLPVHEPASNDCVEEEENKSSSMEDEHVATASAAVDATASSSSSDARKSQKRKTPSRSTTMSSFLSSMTFATSPTRFHRSNGVGMCIDGCDECMAVRFNRKKNDGNHTTDNNQSSSLATTAAWVVTRTGAAIPNAIQQALETYKRQRPLPRTQERRLIQSEHVPIKVEQKVQGVQDRPTQHPSSSSSMISLWQWTLPVNATPLLEFGDSHRLVWVQRHFVNSSDTGAKHHNDNHNNSTVLQEIGTGVVGSQQEQQGRKPVDWKQGGVYFVPSRQGKAIGWVHETTMLSSSTSSSTTNAAVAGPVVLYIVKVPALVLQAMTIKANSSIGSKETKGKSSTRIEAGKQDASSSEDTTFAHCAGGWPMLAVHVVRKMLLQEHGNVNQTDKRSFYEIEPSDSESLIRAIRQEMHENNGIEAT